MIALLKFMAQVAICTGTILWLCIAMLLVRRRRPGLLSLLIQQFTEPKLIRALAASVLVIGIGILSELTAERQILSEGHQQVVEYSVIALIFCLAGILLTFIPPTNSIHSIIYTLAVLAGFGWILVSLNRLLNLWGFTGDKSFSLIAGIIIVPLLLAFSSLLISTWRRANISQT